MEQDYFKNLPSHITIDILSRLPIRTIVRCKCVCKSWLDSLNSPVFVHLHLSKSLPGLAIYQSSLNGKFHKIYEFEDELDLPRHECHYTPITTFNFPHEAGLIQGSTNGLLLLRKLHSKPNDLYVCNPITRDYIKLQCPKDFVYSYPQVVTFGFGASRTTNQLKVVRVSHDRVYEENTNKLLSIPKSECHVYTLGSGSWRKVNHGTSLEYSVRTIGAFLHGKLHWLVWDLKDVPLISCFDLETELFSTINLPTRKGGLMGVFAFNDCLCLCDNSSEEEIVVWLMKEYGVEKSWTKEFVISKRPDHSGECWEVVYPIKVFKDGDILMAWQDYFLFYSSVETSKSITNIEMFETGPGSIESILHTSSFLSLKTFAREVVRSVF